MSKFGDLINATTPVLIDFYTDWSDSTEMMDSVLRKVAAALGDRALVVKIDVEKNKELAKSLKINGLPTLMLYKDGEMTWRQSGEIDANSLISIVQQQF